MDVSAARAVETIAQDAAHAGKHLYVCVINEQDTTNLEGLGVSELIPATSRFETRGDALAAARDWIFENANSADGSGNTSAPA